MTSKRLLFILGVRRTGVSQVANKFQEQGIIYYRRGFIRIISN